VGDEAPLSTGQLLAALATPYATEALRTVAKEGTASNAQIRALLGQSTHASSVRAVAQKIVKELHRQHGQLPAPTVGLLGTGLGLTGAQLTHTLGADARILFAAEACPTTTEIGRRFLQLLGHHPTWYGRAESHALADPMWSTSIEAITLRCAPFSQANPNFPAGTEAALREIAAVLRGTRARAPLAYVYENTDGLWRHPELCARLETLFALILPDYELRTLITSPHTHSGQRTRRKRVFYYGWQRER